MIIFSVYGFLHKYFSFLKYFTQGESKYSAWTLQLLWGIHWLSTDDSLTPQTRNDNTFTPQTRSDDTLTTLTWHLSLTPRLTRAWNICHPIFMIIVFREFFLLLILYDTFYFLLVKDGFLFWCFYWPLLSVWTSGPLMLDHGATHPYLGATHAGLLVKCPHRKHLLGCLLQSFLFLLSLMNVLQKQCFLFCIPIFIDDCPAIRFSVHSRLKIFIKLHSFCMSLSRLMPLAFSC